MNDQKDYLRSISMKPSLLLFCLFPIWLARADRASLGMYVEDAQSGAPLSGVKVIARFEDDIGLRICAGCAAFPGRRIVERAAYG